MNDLLHCPFCGGDAKLFEWQENDNKKYYYMAECKLCRATSDTTQNKTLTIEIWNKRHGRCK